MNVSTHRTPGRILRLWVAAVLAGAVVAGMPASSAVAASPAAGFTLTSVGQPTNFDASHDSSPACVSDTQGGGVPMYCDSYVVTATNVGTAASDGSPVTLSDTVPAGLSVQSVEFFWSGSPNQNFAGPFCTTTPVQCSFPLAVQPGQSLYMIVHLDVDPGASGPVSNAAEISGGGAPTVSASSENTISPATPAFGVQDVSTSLTGIDGQPDTQAGSHPYQFTTTIDLNTTLTQSYNGPLMFPPEDPKDLTVDLPPGLIGNPQAAPQCPLATFMAIQACPADTQIGTVSLDALDAVPGLSPLYNIAPQPGVAGELGFIDNNQTPVVLTAGVRTGSDYGLRTVSGGIPQVGISSISVTIWGVPADPGHDAQRGQQCRGLPYAAPVQAQTGLLPPEQAWVCAGGGESSGASALPFLTLPSDCSGSPLNVGVSTDSWQNPGTFAAASGTLPAITGCDALSGFDPTLSATPDTAQAGAPTGLSVDLNVPQNDTPLATYGSGYPYPPTGVNYSPLATPDLRDASVSLPAGMTINPSSGDGLEGCADAQIALSSPDAGSCPDASKIGTVELTTPLLGHPLPGDVFLGSPQCDPCSPADAASGRMVRLFIQVNDPVSGVVVKLPGTVAVDQATGQLTATFSQNPQLPFSDLLVTFKGGPRAPLVNPSTCGPFTVTSDLAPWSAPASGPDATPSSTFEITGCGDPDTFAPSFTAGPENLQAGAYSPFVLSFQRTDADQFLSGLSVSLPPGVSAKLAGVPLCSDADASAGTCPAASQVGTVETGAGAGSEPLFLPGTAYLTGPYKGAPYGLAVEVPAIAGPYNLGTVVVRQALYIDPTTAQVTAVSDPFPTALDGIPLRIRRVDVNLNRANFTLNPTNCNPMQITSTFTSTGGLSDTASSPFQVGGCSDLGFSPKLSMTLTGKGKTRSADHPTLTATLTQPSGQANIASAQVALPLSLALDPHNSQHVCNYDTAQAVHGGAVGCPASTIVGQASADTPLLSEPLSGPVYLVQGIRFGAGGQRIHTLPSLLIPLRGQIALDLRAQSAVNGAEQLVTTFATIPDAPVSKFTLQITGGPKGLLVITGRGQTICGNAQIANANFGAQSGKTETANPRLATPACTSHHKKAKRRKHKER